jgi:hypothetical protein
MILNGGYSGELRQLDRPILVRLLECRQGRRFLAVDPSVVPAFSMRLHGPSCRYRVGVEVLLEGRTR